LKPRQILPAPRPFRPTPQQIRDAYGKGIDDVIVPNLKVLFVGINPGLYTAAIGHHFGRPGNRFWPALYDGGFTPRLYSPFESYDLLKLGYGITNLVNRATARADELTDKELIAGAKVTAQKVKRYKPRFVAVVGVGSYRIAFQRPKAILGRQPEQIEGAALWVLPNPSGLNAHYQPARLKELFNELHEAAS
jgi:TDG/mug DNA glycosylase family protein